MGIYYSFHRIDCVKCKRAVSQEPYISINESKNTGICVHCLTITQLKEFWLSTNQTVIRPHDNWIEATDGRCLSVLADELLRRQCDDHDEADK